MDAAFEHLVTFIEKVGWQAAVIGYFLWRDYNSDKRRALADAVREEQRKKEEEERNKERKETDAYIKSMLLNFSSVCTHYNVVADQTVKILNNHVKLLEKIYIYLQKRDRSGEYNYSAPKEPTPEPQDVHENTTRIDIHTIDSFKHTDPIGMTNAK